MLLIFKYDLSTSFTPGSINSSLSDCVHHALLASNANAVRLISGVSLQSGTSDDFMYGDRGKLSHELYYKCLFFVALYIM